MIEYIKMIPLSFFFALPWTLIVFALGTYIFRDNKIKININTLPNIKVNNDTDCIVKIIPPNR
jgi:hypothetical protein